MKKLIKTILSRFTNKPIEGGNQTSKEHKISIIGSWRLIQYSDLQGEALKPRWKEVWSFAAMDETENDGIYVCDYINLHSIVGKWALHEGNHLKLTRKESENSYFITELTDEKLTLKIDFDNQRSETYTFERIA